MATCKLVYSYSNQAALLSSLIAVYFVLILIVAAYSFNYLDEYRSTKYKDLNLFIKFKWYIKDLFYRRLSASISIISIHLLDQITDLSVMLILYESSTSNQNDTQCKSVYRYLFITVLSLYLFYKLSSFVLLCVYSGLSITKPNSLKLIKLFITQISEIEIIATIFENYLFDKLFHATKLITVIYSAFVAIPMCYIQFIHLFIYNASTQKELVIFSLLCSMFHIATSILCLYEHIKYHDIHIILVEIAFIIWKLIDIFSTMLLYTFCYFILGKLSFIIIMSLLFCAAITMGITTKRYLYCLFSLILNDIHTPLLIYQGLSQMVYLILITIWIKVDVNCTLCPSFNYRHSFIFNNKILFGSFIACWIVRFVSCFPFFVFFRPKFYFFTTTAQMLSIEDNNFEFDDLDWNDTQIRENIILEREWYRNNYSYYDVKQSKTILMLSVHVRSPIICNEILKRSHWHLWRVCDTQNKNVLDYLFRSDRTITSKPFCLDNHSRTQHYDNLDFLTRKENEWISYLHIIYLKFPYLKSFATGRNIFLCACFIGDFQCITTMVSRDETIVNSVDLNGFNGYKLASLAHQEHICQFLLFEYGIGPISDINPSAHKCLLLGTASAGKSTLFKMIKTIYSKEMTETERLESKHVICQNLVYSIIDLLRFTCNISEQHKECLVDLNDESTKQAIQVIVSYSSEGFYDEESDPLNWNEMKSLAESLHLIWNLNAIQQTIERNGDLDRDTHVIMANLQYFFSKIFVIFSSDYVPSKEDVLRTRVWTTGLIESPNYQINSRIFKIIDVGGTRNARKNWIHLFDNIDTVLFICSLASFNETLFEDEMVSSIKESLDLFDSLIHCKWLKQHRTKIYLLFGQNDRYRKLLKSKGPNVVQLLKRCFGGMDGDESLKYLVYNDELFYSNCTLLTHGFIHHFCQKDFHIKDVLKLIDLYCDAYWESFYGQTIKYITGKFLNRNRNESKQIKTFVLSFLSEEQVKNVMYQITNKST